MKFSFETKLQTQIVLKWFGWTDGPFASVCIQNSENLTTNTEDLFDSILNGMNQLYPRNHHRAFIFFEGTMFKTAQSLIEYAKKSDEVEIFVELLDTIDNIGKFQYLELQNYFKNMKTDKFLILSVAPHRKPQAQRLQVYDESDE